MTEKETQIERVRRKAKAMGYEKILLDDTHPRSINHVIGRNLANDRAGRWAEYREGHISKVFKNVLREHEKAFEDDSGRKPKVLSAEYLSEG